MDRCRGVSVFTILVWKGELERGIIYKLRREQILKNINCGWGPSPPACVLPDAAAIVSSSLSPLRYAHAERTTEGAKVNVWSCTAHLPPYRASDAVEFARDSRRRVADGSGCNKTGCPNWDWRCQEGVCERASLVANAPLKGL